MTWDDVAADFDSISVWPDNYETVAVFLAMGTQWRVGQRGPYGLDYNALPVVCDLMEVRKKDRPDLFSGIRAMESAALNESAKRQG